MRTMRWIGPHNAVPALCIAAVVGAAFYSLIAPPPRTPELDASAGRRAVIVGIVTADPDVRDQTVRLTVRPESISGTPLYGGAGKVIVSVDRFSDVAYGDRVSVNGILEKPEVFGFTTLSGKPKV